jgi:hypothetical protein
MYVATAKMTSAKIMSSALDPAREIHAEPTSEKATDNEFGGNLPIDQSGLSIIDRCCKPKRSDRKERRADRIDQRHPRRN